MKAWLIRVFSGKYLFHLIVWLVYGVYNLMNVEDYIHKKGWGGGMLRSSILNNRRKRIAILAHSFSLQPYIFEEKDEKFCIDLNLPMGRLSITRSSININQ